MLSSTEWKIDFTVTDMRHQAHFLSGDGKRDALDIVYENGYIVSLFYYAHTEKPLTLISEAHPGDTVSLVFRQYRIEQYVNGVLLDEEWPFGEPLFLSPVPKEINTELTESPAPEIKEEPTVIDSFIGAEGWCPGNGVFAGDCMPYCDGDRYHVLYLKDRHHHGSKWCKGAHQWAHISTTDLIHWDIHPLAVPIDDTSEGSICTGSFIKCGGKYYLYYSVRSIDGSPAPIRRSVSDDGYHFTKDKVFSFILSERYCGERARDPKVVMGENGILHMFVTTTDYTVNKGCLVHLISEDGESFREIGNVYTALDENEPECPDYFSLGGKYYLIFSHHGKGEYLVSEKPFEGFTRPEDNKIPCSSVPKCAVWNGRIIFTGFKSPTYAGTLTFKEAVQNADGTLSFKAVEECEKHRREI